MEFEMLEWKQDKILPYEWVAEMAPFFFKVSPHPTDDANLGFLYFKNNSNNQSGYYEILSGGMEAAVKVAQRLIEEYLKSLWLN